MNNVSKTIMWADKTLNPVVGCTYGCSYCYAKKMNDRFKWVDDFSNPKFFLERLKQLYSKKPSRIFLNSMSDIADWKEEWVLEVLKAVADNPQHTYFFLTKRVEDIFWYFRDVIATSNNIFLGITVTRQEDLERQALHLINTSTKNTFINIEPMHGPINLSSIKINDNVILDFLQSKAFSLFNTQTISAPKHIIIGAETGNRKDKVKVDNEWIISLFKQCRQSNISIFIKNSINTDC